MSPFLVTHTRDNSCQKWLDSIDWLDCFQSIVPEKLVNFESPVGAILEMKASVAEIKARMDQNQEEMRTH
jgi:hypothetical protein